MLHRFSRVALTAAFLIPAVAIAQTTPLARGDHFFDASGSVSFHADLGPHLALLRNRKVVMAGFKDERVFRVGKHFAWASTMELPVSFILPPDNAPSAECWWRVKSGTQECYAVAKPNYPVAAVGVTPFGIKLYLGPSSRVRWFGSVAGGVVMFDRNTPVKDATALNFAAEYLLGVDVGVSAQRSVEVAWKFQHWSNANLSHFNPGLDVNLISVGLKRRR